MFSKCSQEIKYSENKAIEIFNWQVVSTVILKVWILLLAYFRQSVNVLVLQSVKFVMAFRIRIHGTYQMHTAEFFGYEKNRND